MAFAFVIEILNIRLRQVSNPVKLRKRPELPTDQGGNLVSEQH